MCRNSRITIITLLSLALLVPLFINAQTPSCSKPAGDPSLSNKIDETQQSINELEDQLQQQQRYLEDLNRLRESKTEMSLSDARIDDLQKRVDELTAILSELSGAIHSLAEAEEHNKQILSKEPENKQLFTAKDSLRLVKLRRREAISRQQIDAITLDILSISKKLQDPKKRLAVAKRLKTSPTQSPSTVSHSDLEIETISARSIDLAAVKLVREGKSLDQARIMIIDGLQEDKIRDFYQQLSKEERYHLYDIADEIAARDESSQLEARRSALYFYFYSE